MGDVIPYKVFKARQLRRKMDDSPPGAWLYVPSTLSIDGGEYSLSQFSAEAINMLTRRMMTSLEEDLTRVALTTPPGNEGA